jgi:hypothetical protein
MSADRHVSSRVFPESSGAASLTKLGYRPAIDETAALLGQAETAAA